MQVFLPPPSLHHPNNCVERIFFYFPLFNPVAKNYCLVENILERHLSPLAPPPLQVTLISEVSQNVFGTVRSVDLLALLALFFGLR